MCNVILNENCTIADGSVHQIVCAASESENEVASFRESNISVVYL